MLLAKFSWGPSRLTVSTGANANAAPRPMASTSAITEVANRARGERPDRRSKGSVRGAEDEPQWPKNQREQSRGNYCAGKKTLCR